MQTTGTSKNRSRKRKLCDSFCRQPYFLYPWAFDEGKNMSDLFKISQTYFELCALYFFFAPRGGENYPEKDRQIMIAEILLKSAGSYTVKNKCRQEDVAGTCLVHSAAAFMLNGVFSCCCSNRAHARCGT